MLLDKRVIKILKTRRKIYEFLIKCEACNVERWLLGIKCNYGKAKFCSKTCATTGMNNPFYGKKHTEENLRKCSEIGSRMLEIKKEELGDAYDEWYKQYCQKISSTVSGENNPFYGKRHTDEAKIKMSQIKCDQIASGKIVLTQFSRGLKGWYVSSKMNDNFYYDSFYELVRMKLLDADPCIVSWTKKHGIKIKYTLDGKEKYYVPDFLIKANGLTLLEEVKGFEEKIKKAAKFSALENYGKENDIIIKVTLLKDLNIDCLKHFGHSLATLRSYFKEGKF